MLALAVTVALALCGCARPGVTVTAAPAAAGHTTPVAAAGDGDGDVVEATPGPLGATGYAGRATARRIGTVDIYAVLPLRGVARSESIPLINGIKLALLQAHGVAGGYAVRLMTLDDAAGSSGAPDPGTAVLAARRALQDRRAVAVIADPIWVAAASGVLSRGRLALLSPASVVAVPGRSLVQLAPAPAVQAGVDVLALRRAGCSRVAIASDGSAAARAIVTTELRAGVGAVVGTVGGVGGGSAAGAAEPLRRSLRAFLARAVALHAGCIEYAGSLASGAVAVAAAAHRALPAALILGTDGVCTQGWTNSRFGGVARGFALQLECTAPAPDPYTGPAAHAFRHYYRIAYGTDNPDPAAVYGYEAMSLTLDAIARLGSRGSDRAAVLQALLHGRRPESVLGPYSIGAGGMTSRRSFGLFGVSPEGNPSFRVSLTP